MANPPFEPNEATPAGTDFVASFPAAERAFRDIIESWLLYEHSKYGHHEFDVATAAVRDSKTTWTVGALHYTSDTGTLDICSGVGPVAWTPVNFPTGTVMLFRQSAAPTGWTKLVTAGYNNAAFRCVTGTITDGGTADFTDVFTARTILQTNLPNVNFTGTATAGTSHNHSITVGPGTGDDAGSHLRRNDTTNGTINVGSEAAHTHPVSVSSGGSGTAMDFAVRYIDVIAATKN